jgi:hypothetical protein
MVAWLAPFLASAAAPAVITAGAGLIGGLMDQGAARGQYSQQNADSLALYQLQRRDLESDYLRTRADNRADWNDQLAAQKAAQASYFTDLRASAEAAGFNPASVLGMGGPSPLPSLSSAARVSPALQQAAYMPPAFSLGSALRDAGVRAAETVSLQQIEAANARAKAQELQRKVDQLSLTPAVPGVYADKSKPAYRWGVTNDARSDPPVSVFVPTASASGNVGLGASSDSPDIEQLVGAYVQSALVDNEVDAAMAYRRGAWFPRLSGFNTRYGINSVSRSKVHAYTENGESVFMLKPKVRPSPQYISRRQRLIASGWVDGSFESTPENIKRRYIDW